MDDNEPSLPRLGPFSFNESIPNNPTRKRVRNSSFNAPSSDPAFFSSDDNPDADNYGREQRTKKKFRGPWFQQVLQSETGVQEHELPLRKTERKFERKYDSGVYLESDGTDFDDTLLEHGVHTSSLPLRQSWPNARTQPERSPGEIWVQGRIQRCLEDGNERIDLSDQDLTTVSNASIRPLSTFTTIPSVSQGVFYQLEPNLKIFLNSNKLTSLPEELFQLERLKVLSLRSNALREIPSAIGKLLNLKELSISQNELEYLPFEILDLFLEKGSLISFTIHPNPFLQPHDPKTEEAQLPERPPGKSPSHTQRRNAMIPRVSKNPNPHWEVSFQARTDIRYFDKYGLLIKGPTLERQANEKDQTIPTADLTIPPSPPALTSSFASRAPSLIELALKSCLRTSQPSQLPSLLPPDTPDHLISLLSTVTSQKHSGAETCTICSRQFVVKRTEWIEWWEISRVQQIVPAAGVMKNERDVFESKVPLVRRGCSWFCVPGNEEEDGVEAMDEDDGAEEVEVEAEEL